MTQQCMPEMLHTSVVSAKQCAAATLPCHTFLCCAHNLQMLLAISAYANQGAVAYSLLDVVYAGYQY